MLKYLKRKSDSISKAEGQEKKNAAAIVPKKKLKTVGQEKKKPVPLAELPLWYQCGKVKYVLPNGMPGLSFIRDFIPLKIADALFEYFITKMAKEQTKIFIERANAWKLEPRWTASFSKYGSTYSYNDKVEQGEPYSMEIWYMYARL